MLTYRWRRRGQEFIFSWPVSSPFPILYVNLWMIGRHTDNNGNIGIMKVICDVRQFVVVIPVPDEISATLASYFMQHVDEILTMTSHCAR